MKCKICNRDAVENDYCELHARAYESLINKYDRWKEALGASWKEYLREIAKNPLTGEWAREVAGYLTSLERK